MLNIEKIDASSKAQVRRFVGIPFQFYQNTPQWVPPIRIDVATMLNRKKHPFYEHSDGDFFIAVRDGKDVGRLAVLENVNFNRYHDTHKAQFYFFECEEDQDTAAALFERAFEWARSRGLDTMIGPKGLGPLDGYGVLVEGFEHRQMMTMMNYNHPYLPRLLQELGFEKEVDFVSCYVHASEFNLPDRVHHIAERVQQRGTLNVRKFKDKRELISWAPRIGKAYNKAFVNNWEYVPLTEREIDFVVDNIMTIADPRLMKIITHNEDVVGFLFAFPDVSAALQRSKGHLLPFGIFDLLLEMRRTKWISLNGEGILTEFQGRGGNALLYSEIEKTVRDYGFEHADMTQVAESAVQMRNDLINLGGKPYKNHRVYRRKI
jgi:GNAT superfamily N-acetyltransferase